MAIDRAVRVRGGAGLLPSFSVAVSAIISGLFWLPLRFFQEGGIASGWAGVAYFTAALALILPVALLTAGQSRTKWHGLVVTGFATGGSIAAYSASFLLTEVVRSLVLFYMMPVWSTLLGVLFLGERLTKARLAALGLCLGGMLSILGADAGWPWPRNAGDWLAIAAGMSWAYGSFRIFNSPEASARNQTVAMTSGGLCVALLIAVLLPADLVGELPSLATLSDMAVPLLAFALFMALPMCLFATWGSKRIAPGRVGLLFTLEVVVGIGSAAVLAGEPFGLNEALGSALVIAGTMVEVLGSGPRNALRPSAVSSRDGS